MADEREGGEQTGDDLDMSEFEGRGPAPEWRVGRRAAELTIAEIGQAIHDCEGVLTKAAKVLGVSRRTLYNRIKDSEALQWLTAEIREIRLDEAEAELLHMAHDRDHASQFNALKFFLQTQGKSRGYGQDSLADQLGEGVVLQVTVPRRLDGGDD